MKKMNQFLLCIIMCLISACSLRDATTIPGLENENFPDEIIINTPTPFKPVLNDVYSAKNFELWIPDYLDDVKIRWKDNSKIIISDNKQDAVCSLQAKNQGNIIGYLTFAFVTPFNSIQDQVTKEQINHMMLDDGGYQSANGEVLVSELTYSVLSEALGDLSDNVLIVPEKDVFAKVSQSSGKYGVIPFDQLEPQWKVLQIEGFSPFDKHFDQENYYLSFPISVICKNEELSASISNQLMEVITNRSDEKITSILLTGTTALTRATADRMEKFGNTYPGEEVKFWFDNSDIRHISSETAFFDDCPSPNPVQENLVFCSHPKYLELFTFLPVDIIELTGNHLLDKGIGPFENTLSLLNQSGLKFYAAGYSLEEAQKPVFLEHNGNQFAFIGCNQAGPVKVWATGANSGVNNCDYGEMTDQIRTVKQAGYIPIVTFQYYESNSMRASTSQMRDFRAIVDAGAVIVSGSQSHVPMSMEIYFDAFIHYGLGNLFFDQMDSINNRREFLDRHIFYEGRYIGTELLTAMLENYAQPRPMTVDEREGLLQDAFKNFTIINKED